MEKIIYLSRKQMEAARLRKMYKNWLARGNKPTVIKPAAAVDYHPYDTDLQQYGHTSIDSKYQVKKDV